MKRLNKKGFTLIELLAVIVILAVLLAIAIPNVSKYINSSKKQTYIVDVKNYLKAAKQETISNGKYQLPVNKNDAVIITFKALEKAIESGGETSPYGGAIDKNSSFIMIVNTDSADDPTYAFYIAAIDGKGYGIGKSSNGTSSAEAIEEKLLKEENIVQLGTGRGINPDQVDQAVIDGVITPINRVEVYK